MVISKVKKNLGKQSTQIMGTRQPMFYTSKRRQRPLMVQPTTTLTSPLLSPLLRYIVYSIQFDTHRVTPTQTHAYKNNKTFFVVGCVIYKTQCGSDTVECEFAAENVINDSPEVANEVSEEEEVFNSTYVSCVVLYCTTYKRGKSELARNSSNKAEA